MSTVSLTLLSVLAVSVISLAGVLLLSLSARFLRRAMFILVSFSTGVLLGNVFLHILPEVMESGEALTAKMAVALAGVIGSFALEKFIHWRHCHDLDCRAAIHPAGPLILAGDAVHNAIDGVLIATAYLVSAELGLATTVAVVMHEIPQEFGDFAVLLHSGYTRGRALFFNFLSALTALLGALAVLLLAREMRGAGEWLLPLAAGNFLYIAGADLIPELHRDTKPHHALVQICAIVLGIAVMYGFIA